MANRKCSVLTNSSLSRSASCWADFEHAPETLRDVDLLSRRRRPSEAVESRVRRWLTCVGDTPSFSRIAGTTPFS